MWSAACRIVDAFLAASFLIGSALFVAGGILSFRWAYLVVERAIADRVASEKNV